MKPRILILIDTYTIGGAGKVVLQFLNSGGCDQTVPVVAGFWRGPERSWQFKDAICRLPVRFETLYQVCAFDPLVIMKAMNIVKQNDIQLIESHGYKAHLVCAFLKLFMKLPWVAFSHGWTSEGIKMSMYNFIDKRIIRFADRIIPVSENLRKRLRLGPRGEAKATVLPNAPDVVNHENISDLIGKFKCRLQDCELKIGVIGRLSPEKGQRYFVEAMRILSEQKCNIKALIVGDGPDMEDLRKLVNKLNLASKIIFCGYIENVAPIYEMVDVICIPSLSEGMPNVALEAMMSGKAVVATQVGGIPEVVLHNKTGLLVADKDPNGLAVALESLLLDPNLVKRLGAAGMNRVKTYFNSEARVQNLVRIYRSVIDQG